MLLNTVAFSNACCSLYEPGLHSENFTSRAFTFLRNLVPAEFIACGSVNTKTQHLSIAFDENHPDFSTAMTALGSLMHQYPLFNWDPTVNNGLPFCRSDFFSARQFRELDVYSEVYLPLGIDNHCAVHVPTTNDEVMFFGIERNGGPDFSAAELTLLQLAQTHLSNAHRLAHLQSEAVPDSEPPDFAQLGDFSTREAEVLYWLSQGKSNAEIAILLNLSLPTIKGYVTSVFNKIGVDNRYSAIVWAIRALKRLNCKHSEIPNFINVPTSP